MLFRFQWQIDKLALGVRLDPDLFRRLHLITLTEFATRKKCLAKNPLEKETRQKMYCHISTPEIKIQIKLKYLEKTLETINIYIIYERKCFTVPLKYALSSVEGPHCPTILC